MTPRRELLRVGRRRIEITHPDKLLFPDAGVTKLDLARHYERVSEVMVPLVRGHPLAMQSFPGGVTRPGYFAKDIPGHFPAWIARAALPKRGGTVTHVLADNAATLVYLANQNCVTPHLWLSRADSPRQPDRVIFDLDPPGERFAEVRALARTLGELLREAGHQPFAMTTGSRGLHVVIALRRGPDFQAVHAVARGLAARVAAEDPRRLTVEFSKAKREGRIFIDTGRNAYAQHAAAPYAVRARPSAPVATPLHWEELGDRRLAPERWTVATIPGRLRAEGDPWRTFAASRRALGAGLLRLSAD